MTQVLKVFQLVDQDGMAQMQIRGGRIEACLYTQRPAFLKERVSLDSSSAGWITSTTPRRIKSSCC